MILAYGTINLTTCPLIWGFMMALWPCNAMIYHQPVRDLYTITTCIRELNDNIFILHGRGNGYINCIELRYARPDYNTCIVTTSDKTVSRWSTQARHQYCDVLKLAHFHIKTIYIDNHPITHTWRDKDVQLRPMCVCGSTSIGPPYM